MKSEVMKKVFEVVKGYLIYNYNINELNIIYDEIQKIMEMQLSQDSDKIERYSYEQVQNVLSSINEKERTGKQICKEMYYMGNELYDDLYAIRNQYRNYDGLCSRREYRGANS